MPTLSAATLAPIVQSMFEAAGVPAEDAAVVAHSLIDANLCGHDSHGVMRVPQYVEFLKKGTYRAGAPLTVVDETPAVVVADGNWGLGQVQAHRLLGRLIPKAQALGVAAGTLRNCGHTGRLGEYAETAARDKLAFFGAVNSHGAGRRVAPPGGKEGRISTNPICLGAPTSGDPVVLDFGTSAVAEGKVRAQFQKKEPAPPGWLVDSTGEPTTDPGVLYADPRGCILPFGGAQMYKGFGLGLLLDLLCGGLSGGPCSSPAFPIAGQGNTAVFVVFDPRHFGGTEHFVTQTDGLTEYVRSCPRADGVAAITLPGDPERTAKAERTAAGISIPDGTWELIVKTATELGVTLTA
ncbi:Ldh family oxidoreductase [Urbifossiella limnaea]|uniref:Putative oxidoreductase YbiC n=1 Tax=Urbifossiella limnaea TaxID=2528023 RepID=A0A517XQX5_9BACT|nr:Ldh family oxidoreductase [Urbifossiella limnaea]QDU19924.1 putative oxidoreductase YbiC [Urbifossiella limnaea]